MLHINSWQSKSFKLNLKHLLVMMKIIYQKQQAKIIEKVGKENHYEKQCLRNHWRITQQEV